MKLRLAVVGLGNAWESRHRPALRALVDRFEVRAICSDVARQAEQAATEFEADAVDGFRSLSTREDIDAVMLLSPTWYGPLPILAACDAGKAVYCASALDLDPDRAREVKGRVERSGVAFMAEFPMRHAPATLRLKELIATSLGEPQLLFCHGRLHADPINGRAGRSNLRAVMELVDWCGYVVGRKPTSVMGIAHQDQTQQTESDYVMMSLDYSMGGGPGHGPVAQLSCGNYLPTNWPEAIAFRPPADLQVCCERGVAFIDLPSNLVWFDDAGRHLESLDSERPVGEQLLSQFHRAVTSLVRKMGDLEDAYQALATVRTAMQSFEQGRRISLDF